MEHKKIKTWWGNLTEKQKYSGITIANVKKYALQGETPPTRGEEVHLGHVLKRMGYEKILTTVAGKRTTRYFHPKEGRSLINTEYLP